MSDDLNALRSENAELRQKLRTYHYRAAGVPSPAFDIVDAGYEGEPDDLTGIHNYAKSIGLNVSEPLLPIETDNAEEGEDNE